MSDFRLIVRPSRRKLRPVGAQIAARPWHEAHLSCRRGKPATVPSCSRFIHQETLIAEKSATH